MKGRIEALRCRLIRWLLTDDEMDGIRAALEAVSFYDSGLDCREQKAAEAASFTLFGTTPGKL